MLIAERDSGFFFLLCLNIRIGIIFLLDYLLISSECFQVVGDYIISLNKNFEVS